MGKIEMLCKRYEEFVGTPWQQTLSSAERVWFAVYPPADERRMRVQMGEFEAATRRADHGWYLYDLTGAFAEWISAHDYRDEYFGSPEDLRLSLEGDFEAWLVDKIRVAADLQEAKDASVVALCGAASLFGLTRVSSLVGEVASHVTGRLLVFFPGEHEGHSYRLLGIGDGWNYLAVPITV